MKNFILFLSFCVSLFCQAQKHVPQIGEVIQFYPATESVKGYCRGFDCFYDISALANGKISAKDKNRFMVNNEGLTPFEAIEKHNFIVKDVYLPIIKDQYQDYRGKDIFLMLLERDDKKQLVLRIPFQREHKENVLTSSMRIKYHPFGSIYCYNFTINLPFINVQTFQKVSEQVLNKVLLLDPPIQNSNQRKVFYESLEYYYKQLNKSSSINITSNSTVFETSKVTYMNVPSYYFRQPVIICTINKTQHYIPLQPFYSDGDCRYKEHYSLANAFIDRDVYVRKVCSEKNMLGNVIKYTGKKVYYGFGRTYHSDGDPRGQFDINIVTEMSKIGLRVISTGKHFTLSPGEYTCLGFDINYANTIYAIIQNTDGTIIRVRVQGSSSYNQPNFEEAFLTEQEQELAIEQKAKEEQEKKVLYSRLIKNYGKTIADELIVLEKARIENFEYYARKWGKNTAYSILHKDVKIGWSEEKCRASWGAPTTINTSTGSWGVHEQWVYRTDWTDIGMGYSTKYLYFENGKLTSYDY